ncbi:uncharacterized protein LOC133180192 [Saccostrea echinata]|uniref:uncharacterized protein LOC133180192 n=1 Tax=Saccostrea echinata TaxID=191078 RepID=UPI002A8225AF|nr:uncharacterized protein LOC133180192 [Saccostrea echinata]
MSSTPLGKKRVLCSSKYEHKLKKTRHTSKSSCTTCSKNGKQNIHKTCVSSWTLDKAEANGLFYEKETSEFSDFYEMFSSCKGKNRYGFIHPLEGEEKTLVDSLVAQTSEMIDKHGVEMTTGWDWTVAADWPFVWRKCCDAVKILNETCRPMVSKGEHIRSFAGLINFYRTLKEHVQEEMWRSNSYTPSEIPEEAYSELCSKFLEIFLLLSRRGGIRKSVMKIKDITVTSTPDLHLTLPTFSTPSLFVINVAKVRTCPLSDCALFDIHQAIDNNILGQHAGELLLDFQHSCFRDLQAVFGIICIKTSVIFTCLKISTKHYQCIKDYGEDVVMKGIDADSSSDIQEDSSLEEGNESDVEFCHTKGMKLSGSEKTNIKKHSNKSGRIFYTRPFNYLVSADRREIVEFLFWIGVNYERVAVSKP